MSIWAIIPVKPLSLGKSRLSGVLGAEARTRLNLGFLKHTLKVVSEVPDISRCVVVSRDPSALTLAGERGAHAILEQGPRRLNSALTRASAIALQQKAQAVLILPTDLPLVRPADLDDMIALGRSSPSVVIAPDRRRQGTNALLINPAGLIRYAFGEDSFQRHAAQAQDRGAALHVLNNPAFALDIDLPEDLEELKMLPQFDDAELLSLLHTRPE